MNLAKERKRKLIQLILPFKSAYTSVQVFHSVSFDFSFFFFIFHLQKHRSLTISSGPQLKGNFCADNCIAVELSIKSKSAVSLFFFLNTKGSYLLELQNLHFLHKKEHNMPKKTSPQKWLTLKGTSALRKNFTA